MACLVASPVGWCRRRRTVVVEVGFGVAAYPPAEPGGSWRATFTENGVRPYQQIHSSRSRHGTILAENER